MTGFDAGYRTDALISQTRANATAQKSQLDAQSSQMLMQIPQMVNQGLAAGQDYEMNQLHMALQQKTADSALRLQEQEIQAQFQKNKMATMLMVDQVDASREQLRAMKLQNDAAEMQNSRFQEQYESSKRDKVAELNQGFIKSLGGMKGLLAAGYGIDANQNIVKLSPEEAQAALDRLKSAPDSEDRLNQAERRRAAEAIIRAKENFQDVPDDLYASAMSVMAESLGVPSGKASAPPSAPPPTVAPPTKQQQELRTQIKMPGVDPEVSNRYADKLSRHMDEMFRKWNVNANFRSKDSFRQMVIDTMNNPTANPDRASLFTRYLDSVD